MSIQEHNWKLWHKILKLEGRIKKKTIAWQKNPNGTYFPSDKSEGEKQYTAES